MNRLDLISPVDGRYSDKTSDFVSLFSESAIIKTRYLVESTYFYCLVSYIFGPDSENLDYFRSLIDHDPDVFKIKNIENNINHDVKAIEVYLTELIRKDRPDLVNFVHFGLTSEDVSSLAYAVNMAKAVGIIKFKLTHVLGNFKNFSSAWFSVPMMSRTHGQPATPTTVGHYFSVYDYRLSKQFDILSSIPFSAKFGGATGGLNAHYAAYPNLNWHSFMDSYFENYFSNITRQKFTTQIENYDDVCNIFDCLKRINNILIDFCQNMWSYISLGYFKLKCVNHEVGSSTMPHKINPINFENAEANFILANSLFDTFSSNLPLSRFQRDLTDSSIKRNYGVAFSHTLIAINSLLKGVSLIEINRSVIDNDLNNNWVVVLEAIQTILRRNGIDDAYYMLKDLSRGMNINRDSIISFIDTLDVSSKLKEELRSITPWSYIGRSL